MTKRMTLLFSLLFMGWAAQAQEFDLYVSDAGGFNNPNPPWQILKFDGNGENGEVFISDHLGWPQDILFLENDNQVLITNLNDGNVARFNATTGDYIDDFASGIGGPTRMEIGPDGLLYVLQWQGNGRVLRYQLDGTFVDEFTSSAVAASIGLAWDTEGNLYVSSYSGNTVRKFDTEGVSQGNFISTGLNGPTNIWFDDEGNLHVLNWNGSGSVKKFDSEGNEVATLVSGGVGQAEGIDYLPNGNFVIGVGSADAVKVFQPDGTFVEDLVSPGALSLATPNAVVFREKTASSAKEVFQEITLLTPSIGGQFQISYLDGMAPDSTFEVHDAAGRLVDKVNLSTTQVWNASNLADGVHFVTLRMKDGKLGRQKIVVQK